MDATLENVDLQQEALAAWPHRLAGKKVLVIGDLVLDRYVVGRPSRLSREAPIPVLEFERAFDIPGAATNPATNIQALGGQAMVAGIVGADEAGEALIHNLQITGINTTAVVVDEGRPTSTKTRVLAENGLRMQQQLARIDRVDRRPPDGQVLWILLRHLQDILPEVDAVLVSDYKSGLVCDEVLSSCRRMAGQRGTLLTVDSQGNLAKFAGFDLVKANQPDTEAMVGELLLNEECFRRVMLPLANGLGTQALVVTRGGAGLSVATPDAYTYVPVVDPSEVFDVTGAGDTVIAVLTLALAAGASLLESAYLANFAAGLVVRRLGNATVSPGELSRAVTSSALWSRSS